MATITDAHMNEVVLSGRGGGPDVITRCPLVGSVVDSTGDSIPHSSEAIDTWSSLISSELSSSSGFLLHSFLANKLLAFSYVGGGEH